MKILKVLAPGVKQHDLSCNLLRIWVRKYEEGGFDDDAQADDLLQQYEARIAVPVIGPMPGIPGTLRPA